MKGYRSLLSSMPWVLCLLRLESSVPTIMHRTLVEGRKRVLRRRERGNVRYRMRELLRRVEDKCNEL